MFDYILEHYDELPSTNALALQYAREGFGEGRVIVSGYQTAGRGKPGRTWVSPAGENLLFSLLLRPPVTASQAPILTQIACRSIAAVLASECGVQAQFKRPNDLLVKGRKICGILTEAISSADGTVEAVVIGIGLNVNSRQEALLETATSVFEETGKQEDLGKLLDQILFQLKEDMRELYGCSV